MLLARPCVNRHIDCGRVPYGFLAAVRRIQTLAHRASGGTYDNPSEYEVERRLSPQEGSYA
jgi:hypothetical protein